ncbi:leucine-rich repeat domain-containing protein [Acinetobacter johnsonii]|nr:leucine-rich repeat domain-containing protein [Acinetobacter johnsonii]
MTVYTGTADANGDFIVNFSASYTSGQKVIVSAEKDGAAKNIELFAPSAVTGGGTIQFSGNLSSFPNNIGEISLFDIVGVIGNYCFFATNASEMWAKATGLHLPEGVTQIGFYSLYGWSLAKVLTLPKTLITIGNQSFSNWLSLLTLTIPNNVTTLGADAFYGCSSLTSLTIGSSVNYINAGAFGGLSSCNEITCLATVPPTITNTTFQSLKSTCIFKVPAGSVDSYKAVANWSAFAARIQAI